MFDRSFSSSLHLAIPLGAMALALWGCKVGERDELPATVPGPTASTPEAISDLACLRKLALDLTNAAPSEADIAAVEGGASIAEMADQYLSTAAFERVIFDLYRSEFPPTELTQPGTDVEEPARIAQHIVVNDLDYRQIVTADFTVPPAAGSGLEIAIASGADDVEERDTGSVNDSSSDLEMMTDGSPQLAIGLRFSGITVPTGTTISNAYVQFSAKGSSSDSTSLVIQAVAADDVSSFSSRVTGLARTSTRIPWDPEVWNDGERGPAQRTPNVAALLQEVRSRSGWRDGNAVAFVITGSGLRRAFSYDGSAADAAVLHLEFSSTEAGSPVTVSDRPAAGVLATPHYMSRKIGSYRRVWAAGVISQWAGISLTPAELPPDTDPNDITPESLISDPVCGFCHGHPVFGIDFLAPASFCFRPDGSYDPGCQWRTDCQEGSGRPGCLDAEKPATFLTESGVGLDSIGRILANSNEFKNTAVNLYFEHFFGRPLSQQDPASGSNEEADFYAEAASAFASSGYKVRSLIRFLVTSPHYCAR